MRRKNEIFSRIRPRSDTTLTSLSLGIFPWVSLNVTYQRTCILAFPLSYGRQLALILREYRDNEKVCDHCKLIFEGATLDLRMHMGQETY